MKVRWRKKINSLTKDKKTFESQLYHISHLYHMTCQCSHGQ